MSTVAKLVMLYENIAMSFRSIKANKIRSLLTALGVLIGVASVIGLTALGQGTRVSVEERLGQLGANLLIVYSGEPRGTSLVRTRTTNIAPRLTPADLQMIRDLPPELVSRIAVESSMNGQIKFERLNTAAAVIGTDTSYPAVRNFRPVYGSFFTDADMANRARVAVIGVQIYRELFPDGADPVGQTIRVNNLPYRITGIMEEKGSPAQDAAVFIPFSTFQRSHSGQENYAMFNIQAASPEIMYELQEVIEQNMLRLRRLPGMDLADFYIANQQDVIGTMTAVTDTFTLLLGGLPQSAFWWAVSG